MAYFAFHKNISSAVFIYLFIYFLLMNARVPETCWEFFVVKINFKFKFYFEKKMPWSFFFVFFLFHILCYVYPCQTALPVEVV